MHNTLMSALQLQRGCGSVSVLARHGEAPRPPLAMLGFGNCFNFQDSISIDSILR